MLFWAPPENGTNNNDAVRVLQHLKRQHRFINELSSCACGGLTRLPVSAPESASVRLRVPLASRADRLPGWSEGGGSSEPADLLLPVERVMSDHCLIAH